MSDTVKVEFEKFSGFITEYASNISLGGMFIKTDAPRSIGSELSFEIVLSDGFRLVQGTGEVAWTRSETQGPDKPAGMGIRFHDLDDSSRELIDKMVYHRLMDGGKPFELERSPEEQKPTPEDQGASLAPTTPPVAPAMADERLPELEDSPSLNMGGASAFDLGGDSSFSGLRNVLDSEPSTLVEPPPDLVPADLPGDVAAASFDRPLDASSGNSLGSIEEPPVLGDISLPEPERDSPSSGQLGPVDVAELEPPPPVSESPELSELSPVSLPGEISEDPGPPPPPPGFSEPTGQELDDSLLSMDGGMLRGAAAEASEDRPEPSDQAAAFDPITKPAAPALEPWDEAEDEEEEDDWESPSRRGMGRILLPVISVLLLAAAGYYLRDFWMPLFTGDEASVEAPAVAIAEPADASLEDASAVGDDLSPATEEANAGLDQEPAQEEPSDQRTMLVPTPVAAPQEAEPEPEAPVAAALTGIDRITWKAEPNGLQITFWADGRVSGALLSHYHIGGEKPRELLKIRGVSRPYAGAVEKVGDGRVEQIRFGYHQGDSGNEIHVVFDLSSDSVTVREMDTSGSKISIVLN